jgi:hypothetical protein
MLDHVPKTTISNANVATVRAYGTVFKFNLARSVLQLARIENGVLRLAHIKSNFGALQPPIGVEVAFGDDTVAMEELPLDDLQLASGRKVSTADRILQELQERGVEGATPKQLAETVQVEVKTVRNILTELKSKGSACNRGGRWIAITGEEDQVGAGG